LTTNGCFNVDLKLLGDIVAIILTYLVSINQFIWFFIIIIN
jgi:hypothetical protein